MLFGHQNDTSNAPSAYQDTPGVNPLAVDPQTGASLPVAPTEFQPSSAYAAPVQAQPQPTTPYVAPPVPQPAADPNQSFGPAATSHEPVNDQPAVPINEEELLSLKQQALEQLSPLVSHLEQSPEEKFRTTMMMIQSSDNQGLIKEAYAAAQAIPDDKVRAQALLDIVNEINYFTQQEA